MSMKIGVIVDPYGEPHPSGLGRWVLEIAKHLIRDAAGDQYTLYVKKIPDAALHPLKGATMRSLDIRSLWLSGGPRLEGEDVFIFLTSVVPLTFFPRRAIVTALDFAYLEAGTFTLRGAALYCVHLISFWKAAKIACISEETRQNLHRHFLVAHAKTAVIPLSAVGTTDAPEPIDVPEKFFLFAGVLKERKNVLNIVRAFAEYAKAGSAEYSLCIAGRTGGAYHASVAALVAELGISDRVRFLGYVTDGQLAYLYQHATALVFPSLVEGFGMPVLEAMREGLPVITSNRGALAEVAGAAALLVNPEDPKDIAAALARIATEPALGEDLRARGYRRAKEFSWDSTARQFQELAHSL
ncbi:MAG: glycosyl transferase, group 1 [Parcubacteria group bacterium]|nr:glycosyl transferase, group 1 [Parcubacteria group bacterium]